MGSVALHGKEGGGEGKGKMKKVRSSLPKAKKEQGWRREVDGGLLLF